MIRQSAPGVEAWDDVVLRGVAGRRYLPLGLPANDPGVLKVERYTFTSSYDDTVTGTRIRTRGGQPRIEMLDLTQETAATPGTAVGS